MLARSILEHSWRQLVFLSMAPRRQGALPGLLLKRKYTSNTILSTKADDGALVLGQPPPTPLHTVLLRRSRRSTVSKTLVDGAATVDDAITVEPPLTSEMDISLGESRKDRPTTVCAQAVVSGAPQPPQPAHYPAAATATAEEVSTSTAPSTQQGKPRRKPRVEAALVKRSRVPSAAVVAKAGADAASLKLPALPALTLENMPAALQHLRTADPVLAQAMQRLEAPTRLLRKSGCCFASLSQTIVYQQLAGSAAGAIFNRVLFACKCEEQLSPGAVLAATHEELRACGLSNNKAAYMLSLAQHFADGHLSDAILYGLNEAALVVELTRVHGIGRWTADMFSMFHLGRPDVLPVGDLGVRKGFQALYKLKGLPDASEMEALSARWKPFRSVGSAYMWRLADELPAAKRTSKPANQS